MRIGTLEIAPAVVLAPMAGITCWPFRLLCRQYGARLAFTEMIPAAAIVRGKLQAEVIYALKTHPADRPLAYQLFGPDPEEMAGAAHALAALEADIIDLNMGCPVRKVTSKGAGAALMKDLDRARRMISLVRKAVSVPLTVKMRLGWDQKNKNAVELARICEGEGVEAVTVHARTRAQGFGGEPDLSGLRQVVEAVSIPVIGNGGINSKEEAERMISHTGCAGVMVARGARGAPWIFAEIIEGPQSPRARPSPEEKARVILQQLEWMQDYLPPAKAAVEMRKHLCWYSKGLPRATELRRSLQQVKSPAQIKALVEEYFLELPHRGGSPEVT